MDKINLLNSQISSIKQFIKELPISNYREVLPIIEDFYTIVKNVESDMKYANEAIEEMNKIRKNLTEKIGKNNQNLSKIFSQLNNNSNLNNSTSSTSSTSIKYPPPKIKKISN